MRLVGKPAGPRIDRIRYSRMRAGLWMGMTRGLRTRVNRSQERVRPWLRCTAYEVRRFEVAEPVFRPLPAAVRLPVVRLVFAMCRFTHDGDRGAIEFVSPSRGGPPRLPPLSLAAHRRRRDRSGATRVDAEGDDHRPWYAEPIRGAGRFRADHVAHRETFRGVDFTNSNHVPEPR